MEAKNLRVGNFVKSYKSILKVSIVSEFDIVDHNGKIHQKTHPIELTDENVMEMGFSADPETRHYYKESEAGKITVSFWYRSITLEFEGMAIRDINYLHELQNLFFAITNEELEMNPKFFELLCR